jgi:hypothetical protein
MRSQSKLVTRVASLLFLLCVAPAHAQEWSCTAPQVGGGVKYECPSGKGCWVIVWDNGKAQGGCIEGRDVALFTPISAQFKNFPLGDALASLLRNRRIEVKILGDSNQLVTFQTDPRPLQLVLADLQRTSGVALETGWLPQIGVDATFSVCVNATAYEAAMLLYAVTGRAMEVPTDKKEKRINLKLREVNSSQANEELQKALK